MYHLIRNCGVYGIQHVTACSICFTYKLSLIKSCSRAKILDSVFNPITKQINQTYLNFKRINELVI